MVPRSPFDEFLPLQNGRDAKTNGELLLGSVPTIIFFVLLYGFYTVLVHKPLTRVLAERYARTQGAIEKARADVAAAAARTEEYEHRLRDARVALFKYQESRRAQASQKRGEAVSQARDQAKAQVEQARAALDQDKLAAKNSLEGEAGRLASEIIRTVLEPGLAQAPQVGDEDFRRLQTIGFSHFVVGRLPTVFVCAPGQKLQSGRPGEHAFGGRCAVQ